MKNKKTLIYLGIISVIIIPLLILYMRFNNSPEKKYEYNIKNNIIKITEINDSCFSLIKGQTIDVIKCKKNLPKKISSLKKIQNVLIDLEIPKKYIDNHKNILMGLNNNIKLNLQILNILNNSFANDIYDSCKYIQMYKKECINYYSLYKINTIKINLSSKYDSFLNSSMRYINELTNSNKKNDIKISQYKTFINDMDEVISSFAEIKFNPLNTETKTYSKMFFNVNTMKCTFDNIKTKFSKITVPKEGIDCYSLLSKTFEDYTNYICNFDSALATHKDISNDSSKSIDKLYGEANLKYRLMENSFNTFINSYSNFKSMVKI